MDKTTVYIVDDHKIVIDGISSFFLGNNKYKLIGNANSSKKLFADLKKMSPDILLLDINLPGLSGIQISRIIKKEFLKIKIVFLSANTDEDSLNKAIKTGGVGYFSKDIEEKEFFLGLNKIIEGNNYYSSGIQPTLFGAYSKQTNEINRTDEVLTKRELEVINPKNS